jgi:hypothetical protein
MSECRDCRAGLKQALSMDIGWRCLTHGVQRLDQQAIIRSDPQVVELVEAACDLFGWLDADRGNGRWCGEEFSTGELNEAGSPVYIDCDWERQCGNCERLNALATALAPWEGVVPVEGEAHG